jgi:hypothetical protein
MNTLTEIIKPAADDESAAPRITIIYEDRATGLRAKSFSDRLAEALGGEAGHPPACWRSELIELPEIAEEMARDAAASEFVILSLRGDTSLSLAAKRWIESWLTRVAGGPACLVALFDPERSVAPHADGARCYLRCVAARASVAFFAHCAVTPGEKEEGVFQETEPSLARPRPLRRSRRGVASFFPAALAA